MSNSQQMLNRFSRREWWMFFSIGGAIPAGISREARTLALSVMSEMSGTSAPPVISNIDQGKEAA